MKFIDKVTIFDRFNDAVDSLNSAILANKCGDKKLEISKTRDAGSQMYQAYEWSLKRHLYFQAQKIGNLEIGQELKKDIKKANLPRLIELMSKYGEPKIIDKNNDINFNMLSMLKFDVRNAPEHSGEIPDIKSQKQALPEVQKVILKYVDKDANLKVLSPFDTAKISKWEELLAECDLFKNNEQYYILIVGPNQHIAREQLKMLAKIPWSLVFDFDPNSKQNGTYFACFNEEPDQTHDITILEANRLNFSRFSTKPYWFFSNGLYGRVNTTFENIRDWRRNYENGLSIMLRNFAQTFSAPIKVVIAWDDAKYIQKICERLDNVYRDVKFILAVPDVSKLKSVIDEYDNSAVAVPISIPEMADGVRTYDRLFVSEIGNKQEILLPDNNNSYAVLPYSDYQNLEEHFEVLHMNIVNTGIVDHEADQLEFYRGRTISWYGLTRHFDYERTKTKKLRRMLESKLTTGQCDIITLVHTPGVGGTTIGRRLAWELHDEFPTLILKRYVERHTADKIRTIYDLTKKTVLVIVEAHILGAENIANLYREVRSQTRPTVFMVIQRGRQRQGINSELVLCLDNNEANTFIKESINQLNIYTPETVDRKEQELREIHALNNPNHLNPFYLGLIVYEKEFLGLSEYVKQFINDITADQKKILLYVSMIYKYTGKSLPANFFRDILSGGRGERFDLQEYLPEDIETIVVFERQGRLSYCRPSHHLIAQEIMKQLMSGNSLDQNIWRANLAEYASRFINDSVPLIGEQSEYVMQILCDLFIRRNNKDIWNDKFSELIKDVIDKEGKEKIFRTLTECYPNEAHFYAHLARYYSFVDHNRELAMNNVEEAIRLIALESKEDAMLYHIKGMCIRESVYDLMNEIRALPQNSIAYKDNIEMLESKVEEAGKYFGLARNLKNDEYGHIAHIQMLVKVVDFAYLLSGLSRTEFLKRNVTSWFGECIDIAEGLLEEAKKLNSNHEEDIYVVSCNQDIQNIYGDYSKILENWNNLLLKSDFKARIRRQIVRTYLRKVQDENGNDSDFSQLDDTTIKRVTELMEDNILEEPQNDKNIYLWFQAARFNKYVTIDNAIEKVSRWKTNSDSLEALYYLYVLKAIKALDGYSDAAQEAKRLISECSKRTRNNPNRITCNEWYGPGTGLDRLLSKKKVIKDRFVNASQLYSLKGTIAHYEHAGSGIIEIEGLPVFFQPSQGNDGQGGFTKDDENREVYFCLGFSYDGLRADSKSVRSINFSPKRIKERTTYTKAENWQETCAAKGFEVKGELSFASNEKLTRVTSAISIGAIVDVYITGINKTHAQAEILDFGEKGTISIRDISHKPLKDIREVIDVGDYMKAKVISNHHIHGWGLSIKEVCHSEKKGEDIEGDLFKLKPVNTAFSIALENARKNRK